MSKVKIQGNASGTGVVTLTAPNTNTDRTITLPDGDITLGGGVDGIVSTANATAITIDNAGIVTKPLQPAFLVGFTTSGTQALGDNTIIPFNADSGGALFDQGNNFNTSSYRFTAPVSGLYHFDCTVKKQTSGGYSIQLKKNGGSITNSQDTICAFDDALGSLVLTLTLDLAANDYIDVYTRNGSYTYFKNHSYWSGYLIG